jgi:hypothetical protein
MPQMPEVLKDTWENILTAIIRQRHCSKHKITDKLLHATFKSSRKCGCFYAGNSVFIVHLQTLLTGHIGIPKYEKYLEECGIP